jgi:hypothetical protein
MDDPLSQSVPEPEAYHMVREALTILMRAERAIAVVQQAAPDPERASRLANLLIAIELLGHIAPRPVGDWGGQERRGRPDNVVGP